jgi:hypothetical protein
VTENVVRQQIRHVLYYFRVFLNLVIPFNSMSHLVNILVVYHWLYWMYQTSEYSLGIQLTSFLHLTALAIIRPFLNFHEWRLIYNLKFLPLTSQFIVNLANWLFVTSLSIQTIRLSLNFLSLFEIGPKLFILLFSSLNILSHFQKRYFIHGVSHLMKVYWVILLTLLSLLQNLH